MGTQVASLFGLLDLRDNATPKLGGFRSQLQTLGGDITRVGAGLTGLFGPAAAGFTAAIGQAKEFDASIANIAAVLGLSATATANLKDQLLEIGGNTVAGPQAVAAAYYDIVGGVADASTHMAILDASIRTSEAGQADLTATTNALISTMNSYSLGADQATLVSDILTRTVGMGVGTMDEFAAALPNVTGLANNLSLSFGDVGWMAAFLTTKGNSASEATTQLSGIMTAFMNPNAQMTAALQELGFASGNAAVEQLGLVGALQAIQGTQTANTEGFAALMGRVEALRGSLALTGEGATEFRETFREGMMGATEAARQIQLGSASQQMELLKSQVDELGIRIGTAMLPALQSIMRDITPVIDEVIRWVERNPELVAQIGMVALVGAGLALVMIPLGMAISGVGTVVGLLKGGLGLLLTPAGLLIGAILGILAAANSLYPGGLVQLLKDAAESARKLAEIFRNVVVSAVNRVTEALRPLIDKMRTVIQQIYDFLGLTGSKMPPTPGVNIPGTVAFPGASGMGFGGAQGYNQRTFLDDLLGPILGGLFPNLFHAASGLAYVPQDMPVFVHRGEGILTAEENQARAGGMTVQINGPIYASGYAAGREAGWGVGDGIRERLRSRGN